MADSLKNIVSNQGFKDSIYVLNSNNHSEFLKLLPIIIAAVALFVSAYSVYIAWKALTANLKHQKLTVRPLLTNHEEFSFAIPEGIGIILKSCGLGPAIVKEFKMYWNNQEINEKNFSIITRNINIPKIEVRTFTKDGIIEKDSSIWILKIPKNQLPSNPSQSSIIANDILEKFRTNFSYTIIYTSIYWDEDLEFTLKYPFSSPKA